jgi:hypothetical protein
MNRLSEVNSLNVSDIQFSKPEVNKVPGQSVTYQRIRIGIQKNDQLSDLIIPSPKDLLCWGLQEQRDQQTDNLTGYQCPIVLWSSGTPTTEEKAFTDKFEEICDYIVNYLVENRSSFGKHDLISSDLRKFNPLYWKTEKGVRVENKGPTLYARCLYSKKNESIDTIFYDENKCQQVNPLSVLGKHFFTRFALKLESIYIGTKISLQFKLQEVGFRLKENSMKSLLFPELNGSSVQTLETENFTSNGKLEFLEEKKEVVEDLEEEIEQEELEEEEDFEEEGLEEEYLEEEDLEEEELEEEEVEEDLEEEVVEETLKPLKTKIAKNAVPVVPVPKNTAKTVKNTKLVEEPVKKTRVRKQSTKNIKV